MEVFVEEEGHAKVATSYKTETGYRLGSWVSNQRTNINTLTSEQVSRLESFNGWTWNTFDTLWEEGYSYLSDYVDQIKHAKVPVSYKTETGYRLGVWISSQRVKKNNLTSDQILRLEAFDGWVWNSYTIAWNKGYSYFIKYIEKKGTALVAISYKANDGYKLGGWVSSQRKNKEKLNTEQVSKLELLGFDFDPINSAWEKGYLHLMQYVKKEGHANVSNRHETEDRYKLGSWAGTQRRIKGSLTPERVSKLESLGFDWDPINTAWERGFSCLMKFTEQYGHANPKGEYKAKDGYNLGIWVKTQRKSKSLSVDQKLRLESLNGWVWNANDGAWETGFRQLTEYLDEHGEVRVPKRFITKDNFKLGQWICAQRQRKDKLTYERKTRLEFLSGWAWSLVQEAWQTGLSYLIIYINQEGHAKVPQSYETEDGYKLGSWVNTQRRNRCELTFDQVSRLEALGFIWNVRK